MDLKRIHKGCHALHKLGAAAVIFRAIVLINQQGRYLREPRSKGVPAIGQTIHDEITGHPSGRKVQMEFIVLREENTIRGQCFLRLEIVVQRFHEHPRLSVA